MRIRNVHERVQDADAGRVGALIDGLAQPGDRLWPEDHWPPMRFDRPLSVGAVGGHGPIRYTVEAYEPGHDVRFRFTAPRGFHGTHSFEVEPVEPDRARLLHVLAMRISGPALITWPLLFRPLHDALLEDALDRAERSVGSTPEESHWSLWVKILRWLLGRARRRNSS